MYNLETVEVCLTSDFKKYPSRKNYLVSLINSEDSLEELVLYDFIIDRLLDFSCNYKSEITKQGMNHMLYLTDIVNPVIDDEESYQARKYEITERETSLDFNIEDFPQRAAELGIMPTTLIFGEDTANPSYAYSEDDLINTAINNKKH